MAEAFQQSTLDQQALNREPDSPKDNKLPPSSPDVAQDDHVPGVDAPQDEELESVIQDEGGLQCPFQQHQNPECLDKDQGNLHCTDQNQSYLGGPDCLDDGNCLSTHHRDPMQGQCCNIDQDAKEQDNVCSLNSVKAQRHDSPLENEVKVEANDSPQDPQGVNQCPIEVQDGYDQGLPLPVPVFVQDQLNDDSAQQDQGQSTDPGLHGDQDQLTADQNPQLLQLGCDSSHNVPSYVTSEKRVQPAGSHDDLIEQHYSPRCVYRGLPQDQDQATYQGEDRKVPLVHQAGSNPEQHLTTAAAFEDGAGESGGSTPTLVITQAEESWSLPLTTPVGLPVTPAAVAKPRELQKPTDLAIPAAAAVPTDPSPSSSEGGDTACSDLLSLKSDSISLASEQTISRRSEECQEDDTRSVAASSVMSLFHRVQLDPVEREWLRYSAVGNMAAQRRLLAQDSSLALKKDFITGFTALHWAAKQGRLEAVDMMLRSGVDVNVRSHGGYTALHLASIHGHKHIVQALINTYHAKTNVRDYHGKMAVHYWSGNADIFNKPEGQTGGKLFRGRRTQRYALPSLLLSRSRSQGQLNLDFGMVAQSPHEALDLQI
ncbi:uncharacterized protein LOC115360505 isoform X2 [Myripristis murdjan]|uniref:uncharacterized protein LOC115360505 isoform X2 n=1 Tax=Myripristis murdjan TaxID=586833 RepID=UPI0011760300|nr:uncharacterized protein LOC115360505 isoform X2 [Myripristis murdjan]